MRFQCPHCKTVLESGDVSEGQTVDCPSCGREFACEEFHFQSKITVAAASPARLSPSIRRPGGSERTRDKTLACPNGGRSFDIRKTAIFAIIAVIVSFFAAVGIFGSSGTTACSAKSGIPPSRIPEPTGEEKIAIGRVVHAMNKLVGTANVVTRSTDLTEQWWGGIGSAALWKNVNTEGCPERFAIAWNDFAQSVAAVSAYRSILALFAASVDEMKRQGRPIDWETQEKLSKIFAEEEKLLAECNEKKDSFFSILEAYGMKNVKQWEMDAANRFRNDRDLFLRTH